MQRPNKYRNNYEIGATFRLCAPRLYGDGIEFVLGQMDNGEFFSKSFTVRQWFDHTGTDLHGHPNFSPFHDSAMYEADGLPALVYEYEMVRA